MDKLDHQNTHQKQPREVMEQVQAELTKLLSAVSENSRKFAELALVVLTLSGTAHAEDATNKIALNSTPSASVPTAEKGGGQVIDTPYGPLSFSEIQKHPKKDEILTGLKPSKQAKFNEWEEQAGIKEGEKIDAVTQAGIKEGEKIDAVTQAGIKEGEKIDQQLIIGYDKYLSQVEQTKKGEKKILNDIITGNFVPSELKERATKIITNTKIQLI